MDIFECLESLEKGKIEEKDIPKKFFENYDTFNQLIRFNGSYFKYGKEEFKDNKEFLLTALDFQLTYINDDTYCLKYASDRLKDDEEIILKANDYYEGSVEFASDRLKDDKEFALKLLEKHPKDFIFFSEKLKEDIDVIKLGLKDNFGCFKNISKIIKDDKDLALEFLKINPNIFCFFSDTLKNDKDFCKECFLYDGELIKYTNFLEDKEMALFAINSSYDAILHISDNLKADKNFAFKVLKKYPCAYTELSDELKNDDDIIFYCVAKFPILLKDFSDDLKDRLDVVEIAVNKDAYIIKYASDRLKDNKELMLKVVKNDGFLIKYASEHLQKDRDICLEAIKQNPRTILSVKILNDLLIAYKVVSLDGSFLTFFEDNIKDNNYICLKALKTCWNMFPFISERLQKDKAFVMEAIKINYKIYERMIYLRDDKDICLYVLQQEPSLAETMNKDIFDEDFYNTIFNNLHKIKDYNEDYKLFFIKNIKEKFINEEMCLYILKKNLVSHFQKEETILLKLLNYDSNILEFINKQTPEMCLNAVLLDEGCLEFIKDKNLRKDLIDALIEDTLNTFKINYQKYFN